MKILYLNLRTKWYRMIENGIKKEEYRAFNEFWKKRILDNNYTHVQFALGYPKKGDYSKRMTFEIDGIEHREGNKEWGAESGVKYIVIKIGKRIENENT